MKKWFTNKISMCLVLAFSGILFTTQKSEAHTKHYASSIRDIGRSPGIGDEVENAANAADGNIATYATLTSEAYPLAISTSGYIDIAFDETVPTGQPIYIAVSEPADQSLLKALLGGTLGGILDGILDGLIFGATTINIQTRTNTAGLYSTLSEEVISLSSGQNLKIGSDGTFYIKVIAPAGTRRVSVWFNNSAVLGLGASAYLNIHDVFYVSDDSDECDRFITTSYDALGVSVDLLSAHNEPVVNAAHAIDNDSTTYSEMGYSALVDLSVARTMEQNIYLESVSSPNYQPVISFELPSSLVDLDVLDAINFDVYNGSTNVYSGGAASLLTLEALNILRLAILSGIPEKVNIPVNVPYDRIKISYTQTLGLKVVNEPIKIFDVQNGPKIPTFAADSIGGCAGLPIELNIISPVSEFVYEWYNTDMELLHTGSTYTHEFPGVGDSVHILVKSIAPCGVSSAFKVLELKGNEITCLPSYISGIVDATGYSTSNPLNVVLTNSENEVMYIAGVELSDGSYEFAAVSKGEYNIHLINEDVLIGDVVEENAVDAGYLVTGPSTIEIYGSGDDESLEAFVITMPPLSQNAITLSGVCTNGNAQLTWNVVNSNKYNAYVIEMSHDGMTFFNTMNKLNSVEGQSQYSSAVSISNAFDKMYFRIKGLQIDGQTTYSSIIKLENNVPSVYNVYPNPAQDNITVSVKGYEKIQIINHLGQLVDTKMADNTNVIINISNYNSGMYIIRVIDDAQVHTMNFIKL